MGRLSLLTMAWMAVLAITGFAFPDQGIADSKTLSTKEISERINIAGRQRMLTQRMTKAACFAMAGIDQSHQRAIAEEATAEFSSNLAELLDGGDRFSGSTNPEIRDALNEVYALSLPLTRAVNQIVAGDKHTIVVSQMLTQNLPTLLRMDQTVSMIEKSGAKGALPADVASTINQAGLQRMLSQRMSKDLCLSYIGLKTDDSRQEFKEGIEHFDRTLEGMFKGAPDLGVLAAPTPAIESQLRVVSRYWAKVHGEMDRVAAGVKQELPTLLETAEKLDLILEEMDKVVKLWEEYGSTQS